MHASRVMLTAALCGAIVLVAGCGLLPESTPAVVTATPPPSLVPGPALTVAWTEGGDLMIWREGDAFPRRIASGAVIQPFLAPDGESVAYLRGPAGDPLSLWIADTAGTSERQIADAASLGDGRRFGQIVWSPDSLTIYLNTFIGQAMTLREADDLWRVDPASGSLARLLPDGDGGDIVPAPDGSRLALLAAGQYRETPGTIAWLDTATGQRTEAFTFDAVATGSETHWRPSPRWLPDSSGLRVAIPLPDLLYGPSSPSTTVWWVPVTGTAQPVGGLDADFFGLPMFSADGAWIAYTAQRESTQKTAIALMLARYDGSDATVYADGTLGSSGVVAVLGWLPGAARFAYTTAPGDVWIGGPGGSPMRFLSGDTRVVYLLWVSGERAVFSAVQTDGTITLNAAALGESAPLVIATLTAYPAFDAVQP